MQQIGLIGIWGATPLVDGQKMKELLPYIPRGPAFGDVMDEQDRWMVTHPGANEGPLIDHLRQVFPDFAEPPEKTAKQKKVKTDTEPAEVSSEGTKTVVSKTKVSPEKPKKKTPKEAEKS